MNQIPKYYTVDLSSVTDFEDFHDIIAEALDFPDYYGMNWDAFWDCLTDMVSDPIHIELIGVERVQNKFPRHAKIMLDTLKELKHWNNNKYKEQIKIEIVIGEARYEIS